MEPELRTKIMELRDRIRKKREQKEQKDQQGKDQARKTSFRQDPRPPQYANKTSIDLVANLCSQLTLNDIDEKLMMIWWLKLSILLRLNKELVWSMLTHSPPPSKFMQSQMVEQMHV